MEFIEVAQCDEDGLLHHEEEDDVVDGDPSYSEKKNNKPFSNTAAVSDKCDRNGTFDCNICLDDARDPVVTLCGHLYCWPCIFKWIHSHHPPASDHHQQQQCPVCKADISDTALVPLYGRGGYGGQERVPHRKDSSDLKIPRRPPPHDVHSLRVRPTSPNQPLLHNRDSITSGSRYQQYDAHAASPVFNLGGPTPHPMMLMIGEMVPARVFGNLVAYPNSYNHLTDSNPRARRQEMRAERSLNRVSIFLFCCIFLCLVLF